MTNVIYRYFSILPSIYTYTVCERERLHPIPVPLHSTPVYPSVDYPPDHPPLTPLVDVAPCCVCLLYRMLRSVGRERVRKIKATVERRSQTHPVLFLTFNGQRMKGRLLFTQHFRVLLFLGNRTF